MIKTERAKTGFKETVLYIYTSQSELALFYEWNSDIHFNLN